MAQAAPSLPTRFPCWCRATYSWGGETKRDLGFIEGDLIECLNAGDGSWWMGRLHRDKRAMGLFPSNFVQLLDETFRPVTRTTSPMPSTNGGNVSREASPNPTPQKAKTFRKPFQAYASTPARNGSGTASADPSPQKTKSTFRKPFQAYAQANTPDTSRPTTPADARSQAPSPSPVRGSNVIQQSLRPASSLGFPSRQANSLQEPSRPTSRQSYVPARRPSPSPSVQHEYPSTMDSLDRINNVESSPPPPAPPPHRVAYNVPTSCRTPSPAPSMNDRYPNMSRGPSPVPHSPAVPGLTPSPLRDAMEDVMTSLHHMEMRRDDYSPTRQQQMEPLNPWSPEAFEELRTSPRRNDRQRPRTPLRFGSTCEAEEDNQYEHASYGPCEESGECNATEGPRVDNYVERMDQRLRDIEAHDHSPPDELFLPDDAEPPAPPPKNSPFHQRPTSAMSMKPPALMRNESDRKLRNRKSAYELGREMLGRTFTTKSSTTNSSSGYQSVATNSTSNTSRTSQSIMSGYSAGGFSATSAGSLARKKGWGSISRSRPTSVVDTRQDALLGLSVKESRFRPQTPSVTDGRQSVFASRPASTAPSEWNENATDSGGLLGGLTAPKAKKSGFFKKLVESAKTGAASARSSIAAGQTEAPRSPIKSLLPNGVTAIAGGSAARDMGLGGGKSCTDWVQVRRDVNRSNSLSHNERVDRVERCQMMDFPVIVPVDALFEAAQGDEGADGYPVENPTDYGIVNLQLVDKTARFVNNLPPMTNAASLAQGYVCRPYRSDVQRLRAIFTWVSERVAWEEDFEGEVDLRRVIQARRGCAEEVAVLVREMCQAVGLHAEVVRGHLKATDSSLEVDANPRPNHWWNAVIVDNAWRIMDCSLASPTNPKRSQYSSAGAQVAETGWFLARPMEICYTHVSSYIEQQHICPPIAPDVLMALPCACPPYFRNNLRLVDYDTSLCRIENLELVHIQFIAPPDTECFAEVEACSYARDADGDIFESGNTISTRALAQAEWVSGEKRYTVKAYLPGDGGSGTLNIYAGKRGLMHSIKNNPHPLAFTIPIVHTGDNPPYEFLLRHPTPHAQRHDLYVVQPQCARLAVNNTFVFAVRQHPSSLSSSSSGSPGATSSSSPFPFTRPSSAMSMISSSAASTSDYFGPAAAPSSISSASSSSNPPLSQQQQSQHGHQQKNEKPAKLAIQAPSGKILRLMRKSENAVSASESGDGGVWETIIKIGERGTWRGLVLADRSARWCVFGEWECF